MCAVTSDARKQPSCGSSKKKKASKSSRKKSGKAEKTYDQDEDNDDSTADAYDTCSAKRCHKPTGELDSILVCNKIIVTAISITVILILIINYTVMDKSDTDTASTIADASVVATHIPAECSAMHFCRFFLTTITLLYCCIIVRLRFFPTVFRCGATI